MAFSNKKTRVLIFIFAKILSSFIFARALWSDHNKWGDSFGENYGRT